VLVCVTASLLGSQASHNFFQQEPARRAADANQQVRCSFIAFSGAVLRERGSSVGSA